LESWALHPWTLSACCYGCREGFTALCRDPICILNSIPIRLIKKYDYG
jgi:hypothetical protein